MTLVSVIQSVAYLRPASAYLGLFFDVLNDRLFRFI